MSRSLLKPLILFILHLANSTAMAAEARYAVAVTAAPVLNTADFGAVFGGTDGSTLQKDACGQLRTVEFVALPGTVFTVTGEVKRGERTIYRVTSAEYPYRSKSGYYVESRSVRVEREKPTERIRSAPPKEEIIAALRKRVGTGYVWGGNLAGGVTQLTSWYPVTGKATLQRSDLDLWKLAGLDCSGLLFEATGGFTPRNTSALVDYGRSVPVAGKGAAEIAAVLEPLDLIVWPGHVLIVLGNGSVIESRLVCGRPEEGVRIRPLQTALIDIMRTRHPADNIVNGAKEFVIRRWYGVTTE